MKFVVASLRPISLPLSAHSVEGYPGVGFTWLLFCFFY